MTDDDKEQNFTRREATKMAAAGSMGVLLGGAASDEAHNKPTAPLGTDILSSSAVALAAAIRDRKISSFELTQSYLDRIEQINEPLNAIVLLRADEALAEAKERDEALARGEPLGPLHGVPMTLKDSIDTKDMVTTAGTLGRKNYIPPQDATVTKRLFAAGAVLMGKTNTPEFTMAFETDNLVYGATRNPYDTSRTPGGSSGGAGAAVAAAMTAFDIGSDTGGSIRVPAHFNGIAGIKPTTGRVPRTGHIIDFIGQSESLTQLGPLARHVEDLDLLLRIIAGPDDIDPYVYPVALGKPDAIELSGLRVAWHSDNGIFTPDDDTQQTVVAAVNALKAAGVKAKEAVPSALNDLLPNIWELTGSSQDGNAWFDRLMAKAGTTQTHALSEWARYKGLELPSGDFTALIERRDKFRSDMLGFFKDYDLIISPVVGFPALALGETMTPENETGYVYTHIHNLTGWPGVVVRCGTSRDSMPIGILITAHPWAEHVAIAVAKHLETVFGGWRMPNI